MSYDVQLTDEASMMVAAVRRRTALDRIGQDVAAGLAALARRLDQDGVTPSGPPLVIYHDMLDGNTEGDIEICMPVASDVVGDGDVYGRALEGGTMATTIHRGPYPEVGAAYGSLMAWIPANGHHVAGPPRETYLNDPMGVPPEELLTRIQFPVG